MPGEKQALTILEVMEDWRFDALAFLRHDAPKILAIILLAVLLIRILRALARRLQKFSNTQALPSGVRAQQLRTLSSVIYSVGVFVIVFMALMQVLQTLGINIAPLLASAGVAGLAIGFGAQTLVKDVINGFFILIENQFDIGDTVKLSGVQGTVEAITMRRTILRDGDGSVHNVPNSQITVVSNLTRDWTQVALRVVASYAEDSDRIIGLLEEIGREVKEDPRFAKSLISEPLVPGIDRVSGAEVEYLMLVKTRPGEQWAVQRELRRRIKATFEQNHVRPGPAKLYVTELTPGT